MGGYQFTRQFPIDPYFADFCCCKKKLVVEVDGSQHAGSKYDRRRDEHMRSLGYSILRFWNPDVLKHRTSVCETILAALDGRLAEDVTAFDLRFVYAKETGPVAAEPLTLNQRALGPTFQEEKCPHDPSPHQRARRAAAGRRLRSGGGSHGACRVLVSGQIPVTADGSVPESFEDQARLCWANVIAQMRAAGMTLDNLVGTS